MSRLQRGKLDTLHISAAAGMLSLALDLRVFKARTILASYEVESIVKRVVEWNAVWKKV